MPAKYYSLRKSKLIRMLGQFSETDWKQFKKFLDSPYFYHDKTAIRLFYVLDELWPEFDENSLNQEEIYHKIYKGIPYDPAKLRLSCTYLLRAAKKFITIEELENYPQEQEKLLRYALRSRRIYDDLPKMLTQSRDELSRPERSSVDNQLYLYILENFAFNLNRFQKSNMIDLRLIKGTLTSLDRFFFPEKYKFLCLYMQQILIGRALEFDESWIRKEIAQYQEFNFPSILSAAFYQLFAAMWFTFIEDKSKADFFYKKSVESREALIQVLLNHPIEESPHPMYKELQGIFDCTLTICNRRYLKGELSYYPELFQLYKQWLALGLLTINGRLHHQHLKNIITLALRAGNVEFAQDLILKYSDKLICSKNELKPEQAIRYNQAHIYMYEHQYSEVKKNLSLLDVPDGLYRRAAFILRLEALLDEYIYTRNPKLWDEFDRHYRTYKRYLKSREKHKNLKKIISEQRLFLSSIRKIFKSYFNGKKLPNETIEKIRKSRVKEKFWLLKKINLKK